MNNQLRSLIIACALCTCPSLWAETFYVAVNAVGASDSNDGLSPEMIGESRGPWKTLSKAAATAQAGDKVWVYSGDYRQEDAGYGPGIIAIENSGDSAARPIEFAAPPGQRPVVNTLLVHDKRWIVINGLTFVSPDFALPANWRDMPDIVVDSVVDINFDVEWAEREAAVRQKFATYMGMQDYFLSVYSNAIDIKGSRDIVVKHNTISLYTFGIQVRGGSSEIQIEYNDISYCTDGIFTWRPAPSMSNSVIRGNRLRQNFNNGMQIRERATNVLVEKNVIHYSGTSHISVLASSRNVTLRNNLGQFGGYYTETMVFPGSSAINVHTSSTGNIVDGNIAAYQLDLTSIDGNGFIADLMEDGAGVLFKNNVAYRNTGSGLRTVESPNCRILNNTFAENGYQSDNSRNGGGVQLSRDSDINNTLVNNIFYNNLPAGIKSYYLMDGQTDIDHNLYYANDGRPFIWDGYDDGEREFSTVSEIRQNTAWESRGVAGDPQFVEASDLNFKLRSSASPAIDAGRAVVTVSTDIDKLPRPQGNSYDAGAYERGNSQCDVGSTDLQRTLRNNSWALLSLPCQPPADATVVDLFGDDLPGQLGVDWTLYTFDSTIGNYRQANASSTLLPGVGFWIIQVSGASQTLDLPATSARTNTSPPNSRCAVVSGCREVSLAGSLTNSNWSLVGNPIDNGVTYNELNIASITGACSDIDGCTFLEASTTDSNLIDNRLWRFDDANSEYVGLSNGATLGLWEGYWLAQLSGSDGNASTIHFPGGN